MKLHNLSDLDFDLALSLAIKGNTRVGLPIYATYVCLVVRYALTTPLTDMNLQTYMTKKLQVSRSR